MHCCPSPLIYFSVCSVRLYNSVIYCVFFQTVVQKVTVIKQIWVQSYLPVYQIIYIIWSF